MEMVAMDKQEERVVTVEEVAMENWLMEFYSELEEKEEMEAEEEMEVKAETEETVELQRKMEKKEFSLYGKNSYSF